MRPEYIKEYFKILYGFCYDEHFHYIIKELDEYIKNLEEKTFKMEDDLK